MKSQYFLIIAFLSFTTLFSQVTWEDQNLPATYGGKLVYESNGRIFASGFIDAPLFYKDAGDTSWTSTDWATSQNSVRGFCEHNGYLYALSISEFHRSADNGDTWEDLTANHPAPGGVESLISLNGTLYATVFNFGIFTSVDDGMTWTLINDHFETSEQGEDVYQIRNTPVGLFTVGFHGVTKSIDAGASFQTIIEQANVFYNDIGYLNGNLYIATNSTGVLKSEDDGMTWTLINDHFETSEQGEDVYQIRNTPVGLFTVGFHGVTKSIDAGASFQTIIEQANVFYNDIGYLNGNLYIATNSTGVLKSEDEGVTWTVSNNLPEAKSIFVVNNTVFAGGGNDLIYSNDDGATWTSVYNSSIGSYVYGLNYVNNELYASTFGGGVFKTSDVLGTTLVETTAFTLSPNPSNTTFKITAASNFMASLSDVKIVNQLGQIVKNIDTSDLHAVNVSDLSAGTYYVTLRADNVNQVISFIKK